MKHDSKNMGVKKNPFPMREQIFKVAIEVLWHDIVTQYQGYILIL